jgi:hypothetical protein
VSVVGGAYQPALGTSSWSYSLDTTNLADGSHTIAARAADTSGNASTTSESVSVQNTTASPPPPAGVIDQLITPEGATIQIYSGVTGWTAQQVYDLLKPNAYQLALIGPHLTIKVQTQYVSSTTAGASESNGVYSNYSATTYLQATSTSNFNSRPDFVMAHEYGHVWTLYHLYLTEQNDWDPWLSARGLLGDSRIDSSFAWSKTEMIADDYRLLFGTSAAQSEAAYINPQVPDPRTVPGLKDFFVTVWGA